MLFEMAYRGNGELPITYYRVLPTGSWQTSTLTISRQAVLKRWIY